VRGSTSFATLCATGLLAACTASGTPASQASEAASQSAEAEGANQTCTGVNAQEVTAIEPAWTWGRAWTEADDDTRLAMLVEVLAADGTWVEPSMHDRIVGPAAVADHIGAFHDNRPGEYFEWQLGELPDEHHDRIRIPWRLCNAAGATLLEGHDFGVIGSDGRLVEVTSFHPPE
jgi:hypothetical protein